MILLVYKISPERKHLHLKSFSVCRRETRSVINRNSDKALLSVLWPNHNILVYKEAVLYCFKWTSANKVESWGQIGCHSIWSGHLERSFSDVPFPTVPSALSHEPGDWSVLAYNHTRGCLAFRLYTLLTERKVTAGLSDSFFFLNCRKVQQWIQNIQFAYSCTMHWYRHRLDFLNYWVLLFGLFLFFYWKDHNDHIQHYAYKLPPFI